MNLKYIACYLALLVAIQCGNTPQRVPEVVAAEAQERLKPLLSPAGGTYFKGVNATVVNYSGELEYSTGTEFKPMPGASLSITQTTPLKIRRRRDIALWTAELYEIIDKLPLPEVSVPAGIYTQPFYLVVRRSVLNARTDYHDGIQWQQYREADGIYVNETKTIKIRQCVAEECSPELSLDFTIGTIPAAPPPIETSEVSAENLANILAAAQGSYSQLDPGGLAAQMDAAKLFVLQNPSLIQDPSLRQRFLSQDNETSAREACTIIARYLYVVVRRSQFAPGDLPEFYDFAEYYARHIAAGDIVTDNSGINFVWLINGAALVEPYLPPAALDAFEYQRGTEFPTDYSLLTQLESVEPRVALLRDSDSALYSSHTFIAIRKNEEYLMADTYFAAFNGVEVRASAGLAWPFAYRFGPAGSRYLHYVYGY
jgi:hypothetical protein